MARSLARHTVIHRDEGRGREEKRATIQATIRSALFSWQMTRNDDDDDGGEYNCR